MPDFLHQREGLRRARRHDQPAHLLADPLRREVAQPLPRADRGGERLAVEPAAAMLGVEPEKAQNAKTILGDPSIGLADEPDAAGDDVRISADRIVNCAATVDGERIDGEIAPLGIGDPVAAEADDGVPAIGLDILAERGHFVADVIGNQRDGAVVDPGRHGLESGRARPAHDVVRKRGGGEVDVADRLAEKRVADGTADDARLVARLPRGPQRPAAPPGRSSHSASERVGTPPFIARQLHSKWPGTSLPFWIVAGL